MKIKAVALNMHDHNTYDGVLHRQEERHSRKKHNIDNEDIHSPRLSQKFFKEQFVPIYDSLGYSEESILAFTCSNLGKIYTEALLFPYLPSKDFLNLVPKNLWDYKLKNGLYYIDHHQSHAAYAFLSSGYQESDILAIDGQGTNFSCIFVDKSGNITDLSSVLSVGGLWNLLAQYLGMGYLGAGKSMGLAGYGKYCCQAEQVIHSYLKEPNHKLPSNSTILESSSKENIAFTLQKITTDLVCSELRRLQTSSNLCLSGGVAYNGYLNEETTKIYNTVHVPPAVGDEGQSLGSYAHANKVLNNCVEIPNVYSGASYVVDTKMLKNLRWQRKPIAEIRKEVAFSISKGAIVGWYQGKSESGNRALGNRSILADPRHPDIKNIINSKIKKREDFRPFAPSVLVEHYKDWFNTRIPSPYMSRIVPVLSKQIPGVTHVDGTARLQTISIEFNTSYYCLIEEFRQLTGVPMLLNTSFNCHEPIVETPEDALKCFNTTGLDYLVIDDYLIKK